MNVFENWFLLPRPKAALEALVLDFRDCKATLVGDGRLPSRIAGISEIEDHEYRLDSAEYFNNVRIHKWLFEYVSELLNQGGLAQPVV